MKRLVAQTRSWGPPPPLSPRYYPGLSPYYPVETDPPSTVADAILGTTFFGPEAPVGFGRFDSALVTMFCVAAGMGWPAVRARRAWCVGASAQLNVTAVATRKAMMSVRLFGRGAGGEKKRWKGK